MITLPNGTINLEYKITESSLPWYGSNICHKGDYHTTNPEQPTQIEAYNWICGEWFYPDNAMVTIYNDNTCQIGEETLKWEFGTIYSDNKACNIYVYNEDTLCYELSFWTVQISGETAGQQESILAVVPIEEDGDRGTQHNYSRSSEWKTVDITMDNWADYLEFREEIGFTEDAFGDYKSAHISYCLITKDVGILNYSHSKFAVECNYIRETRSVEIDPNSKTYNWAETGTQAKECNYVAELYGVPSSEAYGEYIGVGGYISSDKTSDKATIDECYYCYDFEIVRIQGKIYIFIGE